VDGRIILKSIFKKMHTKGWTGFNGIRLVSIVYIGS
jgi:hypothetical protein